MKRAGGASGRVVAFALASLVGCGGQVDDGASGGDGGVSDAASSLDAASPADAGDAPTQTYPYNLHPAARTCPGNASTGTMVAIDDGNGGSYCVDATEVTVGAYQLFAAGHPTASGTCAGKTDFAPATSGDCANAQMDVNALPVACVDWCDAQTFCASVGKRLCGAIGGGSSSGATGDRDRDQWYRACSAGGNRDYPYGTTYDVLACNAQGEQSGNADDWNTKLVEMYGSCVDETGRLFDLSGNVEEWDDACNGDQCPVRGGSYHDIAARNLTCSMSKLADRTSVEPWRGFRCCAD